MTRRTFVSACAGGLARGAPSGPRLAITMDDVNWQSIPPPYRDRANRSILGALRSHGLHAGLFVAGTNVDNDTGRAIVTAWNDDGHLIGNHTYSHHFYNGVSYEQFSADAWRGHQIVVGYSGFRRFFRFPGLKEGDTIAKRDGMRQFLRERGYRNGHVTIDASDWYYDARLRERLGRDPGFDVYRYRQPYLDHMWERSVFYEGLSRQILGRGVAHTVLIHYNLVSTLFLGDLLDLYRRNGWNLVDVGEAFRDPVFQRQPKTLPAGESLIWALAKETGRYDSKLRYPGEDDTYEKPKIDRLGL